MLLEMGSMDTLYGDMHSCFHTLTITHSVASVYKVDVFYRLQCVIRLVSHKIRT